MDQSHALLEAFTNYLQHEGKSEATQEKYLHDVRAFFPFLGDQEINKERVLAWKKPDGGRVCGALYQFYVGIGKQLSGSSEYAKPQGEAYPHPAAGLS